jgi:two-component system, NtrC family, response regulator GlrR
MIGLSLDWKRAWGSAPIKVAIVCALGTDTLTEEVGALLCEASGFACEHFGYDSDSGIMSRQLKSRFHPDPDIVIVTFNASQAGEPHILFNRLWSEFPSRPLLVIPEEPQTFDAFRVFEAGASDFLFPPLRLSELLPRVIRQALVARRGDACVERLKEEIGLKQIIGESPALLKEIRRIPRFAGFDPATVLISGDSGTGKEVFARAVHYLSPRAGNPFVPVNCGAIPEHLIESEIFGHKRGAFTGAISEQPGLIREAEGGTLFLDEIDSLNCQAQVKLLRFLQEGEYRAVGSQKLIHANVRVIAAANASFNQLLQDGKFRKDLFYRLNVLRLTLPPLCERRDDIPLLARHILDKQAALTGQPAKKLSPAALNRLLSYSWPGNVRELKNAV